MAYRMCKYVWKVTLEKWRYLAVTPLCVYVEASTADECLERLHTYQAQDEKLSDYTVVSLCKVGADTFTLLTETSSSEPLTGTPREGDLVSLEMRVNEIRPHSDGLWICGEPVLGTTNVFCQMAAVKLLKRKEDNE